MLQVRLEGELHESATSGADSCTSVSVSQKFPITLTEVVNEHYSCISLTQVL